MCHVEQRSSGVSLHSHIFRFRQPCQWAQGTGSCNLCFVIFMCCQIGYAANRIALDFDVRRHHLANERRQAAQLDDQAFVLS